MVRSCRVRLLAFPLFFSLVGCGTGIFVPAAGTGGPVSASTNSVAFAEVGSSQTVVLGPKSGAFVASGCSASIVTTAISHDTLTVTSVGAGTCTLMITGRSGNAATIAIVVTTSDVTGS